MLLQRGAELMMANWPSIEKFSTFSSSMGDESITTLLKGPFLGLQELHLKANMLGLKASKALVQCSLISCHYQLNSLAVKVTACKSQGVQVCHDMSCQRRMARAEVIIIAFNWNRI